MNLGVGPIPVTPLLSAIVIKDGPMARALVDLGADRQIRYDLSDALPRYCDGAGLGIVDKGVTADDVVRDCVGHDEYLNFFGDDDVKKKDHLGRPPLVRGVTTTTDGEEEDPPPSSSSEEGDVGRLLKRLGREAPAVVEELERFILKIRAADGALDHMQEGPIRFEPDVCLPIAAVPMAGTAGRSLFYADANARIALEIFQWEQRIKVVLETTWDDYDRL